MFCTDQKQSVDFLQSRYCERAGPDAKAKTQSQTLVAMSGVGAGADVPEKLIGSTIDSYFRGDRPVHVLDF